MTEITNLYTYLTLSQQRHGRWHPEVSSTIENDTDIGIRKHQWHIRMTVTVLASYLHTVLVVCRVIPYSALAVPGTLYIITEFLFAPP